MSNEMQRRPGAPAQVAGQVYQPAGAQQALANVSGETAGGVLAAQAKALVEARYLIALRQPRDMDVVRQKLLKECSRPSFAEGARYHKPIGEGVEGPSIRFVEAALAAMGNVDVTTITVYDDPEKRIMRVSVIDVETNVVHSKDVSIRKAVERRRLKGGESVLRQRQNKAGQTVYLVEATDDEMLNSENALVSKALRTQGLRLVPGWLTAEAMEVVIQTQQKKDALDPDAARNRLLDAFAGVGVSAQDVAEYLGHTRTPTPKEMVELRAIFQAIRDGEASWREVMDAVPAAPGASPAAEVAPAGRGVAAVAAKLAAETAPAAAQAPAAAPQAAVQAPAPSAPPPAAPAAPQEAAARPAKAAPAKESPLERIKRMRDSDAAAEVKGQRPLVPMPPVGAPPPPRDAREPGADDDREDGPPLPDDSEIASQRSRE